MIQGDAYAYSNFRCYARPADDGLSTWHPAYLRLGPTLERCARSYALFCRRYKPGPKKPSWPRWGGWRLWREIAVGSGAGGGAEQADLFAWGARYHGGMARPRRGLAMTILRPDVLREVEHFIHINQPPAGLPPHAE